MASQRSDCIYIRTFIQIFNRRKKSVFLPELHGIPPNDPEYLLMARYECLVVHIQRCIGVELHTGTPSRQEFIIALAADHRTVVAAKRQGRKVRAFCPALQTLS